ncbi:heavy metal translocating P-type ATPase [Pseudomonas alcaligenes]|uniref:heavy metal translocating P-type ATPase n=1 Tax=Aquipseudomonas alcaligenes TaxID=43263 RepID=UPI003668678A
MSNCCSHDHSDNQKPEDQKPEPAPSGATFSAFHIQAMDCPTEQNLIQSKLGSLAGIHQLDFNLMTRVLGVQHSLPSVTPIIDVIASLGMQAELTDAHVQTRIRIEQMDCPTEEKLIRDKLANQKGISSLQFNLLQRTLVVDHAPELLPQLMAAIQELGLSPVVEGSVDSQEPSPTKKKHWWPLVIAGIAAVSAEIIHFGQLAPEWVVAALAVVGIALSGLGTYKKGWIAIKNRNLNINALMSIAVTGAILIGQWPEAAMVMVLFAVAEVIEARSLERARNAIRGLMDLTPERATVLQADGSWLDTDIKAVALGAVVRVRPGERIGLDGEVTAGTSTVNQAPITGESLPVDKIVGDQVFAGTINEAGSLEFRVSAASTNTTLARIIHAVEEAQGSRAPTQRFVDRFSQVYTPAVFLVSLGVAILPPLLLGGVWQEWIYRALVLLVVACPCALVISTPVTIVSGLAAAARKGILIKGGVYLESGKDLALLALDKTGTITQGKPVQTDFLPLKETDIDMHRVSAASLAARSDHPVSKALARHAMDNNVSLLDVEDFEALPGRGVKGRVKGQLLYLGNHRLVEELGLCSKELELTLERLERQGKTVVILCSDQQPLALFAVADTVKETSADAIRQLHELGVKTCMLSGDNEHTALAIAQQVGIDEARGNLLPADKLTVIADMQAQGLTVGMVGDGINDAPALAKAQIGFAMGSAGTDTAIETADVALMDDDLRKVATFVRLSRNTAAILKQNIALALGIKAIFLGMAITGGATMWMAVFADMGVSLLVVFNGLRLLRQ